MIRFDHEYKDPSTLGKYFMTSLLWNTDYKKMESILIVMIKSSKRHDIPFEYDMLGIMEC
tara:strand:- start:266 stop:445 length:180 start_codon:yes stop_codon:yes gene_type:complete